MRNDSRAAAVFGCSACVEQLDAGESYLQNRLIATLDVSPNSVECVHIYDVDAFGE